MKEFKDLLRSVNPQSCAFSQASLQASGSTSALGQSMQLSARLAVDLLSEVVESMQSSRN